MLTAEPAYLWAQIGNYQVYNGRHESIQYAYGCPKCVNQIDLPAHTIGSSHWETVTYAAPNGFTFTTDGSRDWPDIPMTWPPTKAQVASEIKSLASQLMGDAQINQWLWSNEIKLGGGWITYSGGVIAYNTSHFSTSGTAQYFDTWDLCS